MTPEQVVSAFDKYLAFYADWESGRFPVEFRLPTDDGAISHALWMCREAKTFAAEKPEKAMRWLGFVQGVLWAVGGWTIEEFKGDNRGDGVPSDTGNKGDNR